MGTTCSLRMCLNTSSPCRLGGVHCKYQGMRVRVVLVPDRAQSWGAPKVPEQEQRVMCLCAPNVEPNSWNNGLRI